MPEKHSRKPNALRGWRLAGVSSYVVGILVGASILFFTPYPNWAALSVVPFTALGSWLFWRGTTGQRKQG
jgi:hypothetical protein